MLDVTDPPQKPKRQRLTPEEKEQRAAARTAERAAASKARKVQRAAEAEAQKAAKRPAREVRLDESERAIVLAFRALTAYVREWTRFDPTLDKPRAEGMISLRLEADGSGNAIFTPMRPRTSKRGGDRIICTWTSLASAADTIDGARNALEVSRLERETGRPPAFHGDPRRGLTRGALEKRRREIEAWKASKMPMAAK